MRCLEASGLGYAKKGLQEYIIECDEDPVGYLGFDSAGLNGRIINAIDICLKLEDVFVYTGGFLYYLGQTIYRTVVTFFKTLGLLFSYVAKGTLWLSLKMRIIKDITFASYVKKHEDFAKKCAQDREAIHSIGLSTGSFFMIMGISLVQLMADVLGLFSPEIGRKGRQLNPMPAPSSQKMEAEQADGDGA